MSFAFERFIGKLRPKVKDDKDLLDITNKLEEAWSQGNHDQVVEYSKQLNERISEGIITYGQREVLHNIQNGQHVPKKDRKKSRKLTSNDRRTLKKTDANENGGSKTVVNDQVETTNHDAGADTLQTEEGHDIESTHVKREDVRVHRSQQAERDDQIVTLQEEIDRLRKENTDQLSRLKGILEETTQKKDGVIERYMALLREKEAENCQLVEREQHLQDKIHNHIKFKKEAEQKISKLEEMNAKLQSDKDQTIQKANAKLQSKKEACKKKEEHLQETITQLKQDIEALNVEKESHVSIANAKLQSKKEACKKREEHLQETITQLKQDIEALNVEKESHVSIAKTKLQSEKELYTKREEQLQKTITQLKQDIEALNVEKESHVSIVKTKLQSKKELCTKREEQLQKTITQLKQDINALNVEKESHVSIITDLKMQIANNHLALERSESSLEESYQTNEDLALRLSRVASAKLTHNNPNIADLSDINRPTKLAERYSELYDNEWTDAYTSLEDANCGTEEAVIKILLRILSDSFEVCMEKANEQMQYIKSILLFPAKVELKDVGVDEAFVFKEGQEKMLTDLRKELADISHKDVAQIILEKHGDVTRSKAMEKYIHTCTELSWKMAIQTPPLYLDFKDMKNELFSKDIFKAYTSMGKYVSFVVWPSLYLYDKGPLLCKGTAQGKAKKGSKK